MNYFMIGGDRQEYGPADAETVRQWVREGRANADTLLRAENETEYRPLKSFPDFSPLVTPSAPVGGADSLPKVITVTGDAQVNIGHTFARAWHLVNEHFGVIAMASLLVWMALTTLLVIPFIGPLAAMIFSGPLYGGLFLLFLKLIREGEAEASDLFSLIRNNALPLILTGVVGGILTELATACCCVIPGVYLKIAWLFGIPIVAERGVNFWAGLEVSRRIITPHWFKFLGLFVVAFLPVVVFHFYLSGRLMADLSPHISALIALLSTAGEGGVDQAQAKVISDNMQKVMSSYAFWGLIRQGLLLVTLPLGFGSFAFVYEDFFGRKK